MTEADFLLLKSFDADPEQQQFVKWSLLQREAEFQAMQARLSWNNRAAQKLLKQQIKRIEQSSYQMRFIDRVKEELDAFVNQVESDPAKKIRLPQMSEPEGIIRLLSKQVWLLQMSEIFEKVLSEISPSPTDAKQPDSGVIDNGVLAGLGGSTLAREFASDETKNGRKQHSWQQLARATEHFSEEEIRRCLESLQQLDPASGSELKEFISELEHLVQEA
jgi:glucose-6-phosphate isomerase